MIFTSLALLSGMVLVSNAAPFSSRADPVVHVVSVSNAAGALAYDPPFITAATGDVVSFKFFPKNHTVTQSSFDAPCTPLDGGVDTGFVAVAPGTGSDGLPTVEFNVDNTDPFYVHCRQGANTPSSHCGKGMVFVVNPGADGPFDAYKEKALLIGQQLAGSNGTASNVTSSNGTSPDPTSTNGTLPDPTSTNGTLPDPTSTNGTLPDPTSTSGTVPNPTSTNGPVPDSTSSNGTVPDDTTSDVAPSNDTAANVTGFGF